MHAVTQSTEGRRHQEALRRDLRILDEIHAEL